MRILTLELRLEHDVVLARQRARQIASLLGFDTHEQTRISTAVSEIARNAFQYAGGGRVEYAVEGTTTPLFQVIFQDEGPGVHNLTEILGGRYQSQTGMGMGIVGAQRLMDEFEITSDAGRGTRVIMGKYVPRKSLPLPPGTFARIADELSKRAPENPFAEVQRQNQELMRTLDELRQRQAELTRLNRELEDTNRGVVALYAELDERADYLRRASELKTRFLSNMTHEFRTPLNSILSLSRLLLDRVDGDLSGEQDKQVTYIRKSAEDLSELVNDLLDLAKVEAGKIIVRSSPFRVSDLFSALRGMLRPLLSANASVSLVFEEPEGIPDMQTDEGKVSQILRNFISNALKFTERGEVRVRAVARGDEVVFEVSDTGIGIAPEDQERIFTEFNQVENPIQKKVRGTGLGLPLSRKLAELLGGSLAVRSEPGVGSTFSAAVPRVFRGPSEVSVVPEVTGRLDPTRLPVLIVEDNRETLFIYDKYLRGTGYQPIGARTLQEARQLLKKVRPVAIVLDILLEGENSWAFLSEVKGSDATRGLPVIVVTVVDNRAKAKALGADDFSVKPLERKWLLERLDEYVKHHAVEKVLVIDDDEVSRYLLTALLADTRYDAIEARDGVEGLARAVAERPDAVFLDLQMPGMSGFEVLERLKSDSATRDIPVIIYTSRLLNEAERKRLAAGAVAIVPKENPSREVAMSRLRDALERAGLQRRLPAAGSSNAR